MIQLSYPISPISFAEGELKMWAHEFDEFGLPCLYSTISRGNFKELLGIIENEFDPEIFMEYFLCVIFLKKLVALNFELYRMSYALYNPYCLEQNTGFLGKFQKIISPSILIQWTYNIWLESLRSLVWLKIVLLNFYGRMMVITPLSELYF